MCRFLQRWWRYSRSDPIVDETRHEWPDLVRRSVLPLTRSLGYSDPVVTRTNHHHLHFTAYHRSNVVAGGQLLSKTITIHTHTHTQTHRVIITARRKTKKKTRVIIRQGGAHPCRRDREREKVSKVALFRRELQQVTHHCSSCFLSLFLLPSTWQEEEEEDKWWIDPSSSSTTSSNSSTVRRSGTN